MTSARFAAWQLIEHPATRIDEAFIAAEPDALPAWKVPGLPSRSVQ
jgi:hypothetical protein